MTMPEMLQSKINPLKQEWQDSLEGKMNSNQLTLKCYRWTVKNIHKYKTRTPEVYGIKEAVSNYNENTGLFKWLQEITRAVGTGNFFISDEESKEIVALMNDLNNEIKWAREYIARIKEDKWEKKRKRRRTKD